jgi:hypothetical protein
MKPCPQCGASNGDDDVFCKGCGASLPKLEQPTVRKVSEPPPPGGEDSAEVEELAKEAPPAVTLPRRAKDKTIVGMPSPLAAPAPAGPPKVRRPGVKAKFHGTLHGMIADVKDMPVHGEEEQEEEQEDIVIDEDPQHIQPIPIMTIGSGKALGEDDTAGKAGADDGVDLEILASATISGDEGVDVREKIPEERKPSVKEEAPAPAEDKEKVTAAVPSVPPPAAIQPAAAEPKSRSATVVVVIVTLILILAGGYYYYSVHGAKQQGTGVAEGPSAAGTQEPPREGEERKWNVKLEGAPGSAVVYVDEVLHPERPVILIETDAPRVFRIEAPGFEPWQKTVAVMADVALPVAMTQAAAPPEVKEGGTVEGPKTGEETEPVTTPEKKKKKKKKKKSIYDVKGNPYDD